MGLTDPFVLRHRTVPSRVVFGPLVTNLGHNRSFSPRHTAFYQARAAGGAGIIVTETISVDATDWPYERAPLAGEGTGLGALALACQAHGSLVLASLGHCGAQGSSAYHQQVLLAPSRVPEVNTHDIPLEMDQRQIDALVASFASAARWAVAEGCDGVEVNAGQHSLLRQFCSPLTNQRSDTYGQDRLKLLTDVLRAVRAEVGEAIVTLRFSADELAPWAGITPEQAPGVLRALEADLDAVTVVRGSIYSEAKTTPDMHEPEGFNLEATTAIAPVAKERSWALIGQGSITSVATAASWLEAEVVDAVEMTRALLAEPELVTLVRRGDGAQVRPCTRCNQRCQVRDLRNPIVSCTVNPEAGHELEDEVLRPRPAPPGSGVEVTVVGAGPAGLEAARQLALGGHQVVVREAGASTGGAMRAATQAPGRAGFEVFLAWAEAECRRLGVRMHLSDHVEPKAVTGHQLWAVGGHDRLLELAEGNDGSVEVRSALEVLGGPPMVGTVLLVDPVGGPIGVSVAELLAPTCAVHLVSPDMVAASQLSLTGDLVGANQRLAGAGVQLLLHAELVRIAAGVCTVADRYTGVRTELAADLVVDAGHRLPAELADDLLTCGDAVAPRSLYEAILEARRTAAQLMARIGAER